jgi:hypothetical protein
MLTIELTEPPSSFRCECCGGTTISLTRFVYANDDAFAVYYASFTDSHPERIVSLAVGMGEWGEGSTPADRRAFALALRATDEQYQVMVVDTARSPWRDVEILGRMLDRAEALADPWIRDVFHVTDHIVMQDPQVKAYLDQGRIDH